MSILKILKTATLLTVALLNGGAFAYSPEMEDQVCKKPKFREFNLTEYKAPENVEIAPESEFSFTLSVWADPNSIKITAKKENIPYTVETTSTYHRVKAKLPASLNGQFVRINVFVKAVLGCDDTTGWLVKVAEKK